MAVIEGVCLLRVDFICLQVQAHQVTQFNVTNWSPDGTCSNLKVLTDVIDEVGQSSKENWKQPNTGSLQVMVPFVLVYQCH